ncbi:MAG TPA: phosphopyruvate hydratase [Pyrinomonadaceae bacterium]|jgi:enolase|nr:phosphopyruvate hydratase [Pyrinomonadaceae bacterium]
MNNPEIKKIQARQIFDSRGRPTVEVDVELADGSTGRAGVPSGASTGTFEAFELRDRNEDFYEGFGVLRAVENVNGEIAAELYGEDALDQSEIDALLRDLDGTEQLKRLGANAVLGVSLATARAAANFLKMPLYQWIAEISDTKEISLPLPMVNILSGGLHAGRGMDVQDFLFIPRGAESFSDAVHKIAKVRFLADKLAIEKGLTALLADEGGLSPNFERGKDALEFMVEIFGRAALKPFEDAAIAIDVAAATLQTGENEYFFAREDRAFSSLELIELMQHWAVEFPIISIEDALGEEDWSYWKLLNEKLGDKIQIVGDDLLTTNLKRLEKAIEERSANAVLIKLNQNGTLTGTLDVIRTAKENGWATIVSARSGETDDSFIADLAVGTAAGQIKIGSFRNSERLSKYNRLLQIEEETRAPFAGAKSLAGNF